VEHFADGVYFVDLASVTDPHQVLPAVARVLGLRESRDRTIVAVLMEHVREKRMLLLLDNFEQVLDAALDVVQLLQSSPWLKVLVTSREALHVRGERRYSVPPLGLPDLRNLPCIEEIATCPSVQLFVERAQAVAPDFAMGEDNAEDVAAVCVGVEGLPLAIELAAARARHLTPREMRAGLASLLGLLRGGARDLPARHRTLNAAIEWSYNLLDTTEQRLFRGLGVFVGGFTSQAVGSIVDDEPSTLISLLSLVDKNLVKQQRQASVGTDRERTPRFMMLETLHEYAREKLEECGEAGEVSKQHALYFLALAEDAEPKYWGPDQAIWFDRLGEEQDNIRAVFDWCHREESGAEGVEIGLRLAGALFRYWYTRGPYSEGRQWVTGVLAKPEAIEHTIWRGRALRTAGVLAYAQGDNASARALWEDGLAIARELGDRQLQASMLNNLGNIAYEAEGDLKLARSLYEQSLTIQRERGKWHNTFYQLHNLGRIDEAEGDFEMARDRLEEALAIARELGDKTEVALSLQALGELAYSERDFQLARSLHEEGLAMQRGLGNKWSIPWSLGTLGYVALRQGEYDRAAALLSESITFSLEQGARTFMHRLITGLAAVVMAQGEPVRAVKLFAACERLSEAGLLSRLPSHQTDMSHDVVAARAQLTEEEWEKAWKEGWAMTVEQAIEYALEGS
jgi:predicted ATPase